MTLEILLLLPIEVFALVLSYMGWRYASQDGPGVFMVAGMLLTFILVAFTTGNAGTLTFGGMAEDATTGDIMLVFLSVLLIAQSSMMVLAKMGKGRTL